MNPSWLFFDLDDTVLPQETSVLAALADTCQLVADRCRLDTDQIVRVACEVADRAWRETGYSDYVDRLGIAWWEGLWGRFDDGTDPEIARLRDVAPEFRTRTWQGLVDRCQVPDPALADTLERTFITFRQRRHIPYPEAVEVLTMLRGRFAIGMITNGAADIQKDKLARSGLAEYFDPVIISADQGVGKPDPAIFTAALQHVGAAPDATVMIGNSLEHDIAGARDAGMGTVWVNRVGAGVVPPVQPDAQVADLRGLLDLFHVGPQT